MSTFLVCNQCDLVGRAHDQGENKSSNIDQSSDQESGVRDESQPTINAKKLKIEEKNRCFREP